jgi:O-methyltransferase involved in polyketide biosynthesis
LISHPEAVIVNLGAGLDTTFYRVDNGLLKWYDIDLPDVIDLRKKLIPDTERSYCIKESIFDMQWIKYLNNIRGGGVLFLSGGVLEYFNKDTVKLFLIGCADKFPGSEIVFNTARMNMIGSIFMKITFNRIGMWTVTPSKLGLINEKTFQKWDKRLVLLENYPLFSRIKMDDNFDRKTANTLKFYDNLKIFNILHLYFSN